MIDSTMMDEFYIVKTKQGVYQLRMTFNKDCLATDNTLAGIILKLENALKRYMTPEDLINAIRNTDLKKMSPIELERQEKIYKEQATEFSNEIEEAITKANKKLMEAKPVKIVKRKTIVNITPTPKIKEEINVVPKPIIKKRKKLIMK